MSELMRTWPGGSARDVVLGAMGGYIASSNPNPIFGLTIEGPDGNAILMGILLVMALYILESTMLTIFNAEPDEDDKKNQQTRRPRITS